MKKKHIHCKHEDCKDVSIETYDLCKKHKCKVKNCDLERLENCDYCEFHKCTEKKMFECKIR